jgi:hypothetical protein
LTLVERFDLLKMAFHASADTVIVDAQDLPGEWLFQTLVEGKWTPFDFANVVNQKAQGKDAVPW